MVCQLNLSKINVIKSTNLINAFFFRLYALEREEDLEKKYEEYSTGGESKMENEDFDYTKW